MRIVKYLLISLLTLIASCAKEGPYTLGKLEVTEMKVSEVTPTTAVVTIILPSNSDIIPITVSNWWISDKPFEVLPSRSDLNELQKKYDSNRIYSSDFEKRIFFRGLTPDTRYYLLLKVNVRNHEEGVYADIYYNTDFSFTTSKKGDYTIFGKPILTNSFVSSYDNTYHVWIKFPNEFQVGGRLDASLYLYRNPDDITDRITVSHNGHYVNTNTCEFVIDNLDNSIYYLAVEGKLSIRLSDGDYYYLAYSSAVEGLLDISLGGNEGESGGDIIPPSSSGLGTITNPFSVPDVLNGSSGASVWVQGYIVGFISGMSIQDGAVFSNNISGKDYTNTNILIAASPDETDWQNCVPVELPVSFCESLGLGNNPSAYKRLVNVCGSIEQYFGCQGVKDLTNFGLVVVP